MASQTFKLIYLTGAPAAGKTTLCNELKKQDRTIDLFEYGSEMVHLLESDPSLKATVPRDELRKGTSEWVTQAHIDRLDSQMIAYCNAQRLHSHVIIDSRHVTNEDYGFRISAFSQEKLKALALTEIWMLYTSPQNTIRRLTARPRTGLVLTQWDLQFQIATLATLVAQYGILAGVPVFLYDTSNGIGNVVSRTYARLTS